MYKKIFLGIAILISYNTKIYSTNYFSYAWHNSCRPTAILVGLASLGIFLIKKDQNLILPLAGITALSTAASGIGCVSSIFIGRTVPVLGCSDNCTISNTLACNKHNPNDSIKHAFFQSLRQHSHRLGTLAGLAAGAGGYVWYKNHYA